MRFRYKCNEERSTVTSESRIYLNAIREAIIQLASEYISGPVSSTRPRKIWSHAVYKYFGSLEKVGSKTLLISRGMNVLAKLNSILKESIVVSVNKELRVRTANIPSSTYTIPIMLAGKYKNIAVNFVEYSKSIPSKLEVWVGPVAIAMRLAKVPWVYISLMTGKMSPIIDNGPRKADEVIMLGLLDSMARVKSGYYYARYSIFCRTCPYRRSCERDHITKIRKKNRERFRKRED